MPHFKITISGRGIDCAVGEGRAVGFFTTRLVQASNLAAAESEAKELVLSEWRQGGEYSSSNRASLPSLAVEESFPRSEENTSELTSLMRISYAVFSLQKNTQRSQNNTV